MGPKSGNVEKVLVFKAFLNGQRGDEYSREVLAPSERRGFGVILGSLWGHFLVISGSLSGNFGDTSGSFRGCSGVILGVILGSLWGHFGVISGSFRGHFGDIFFFWKDVYQNSISSSS